MKKQLKKIIKEEVKRQLNELFDTSFNYKKISGTFPNAEKKSELTDKEKDGKTIKYKFSSPNFNYLVSIYYHFLNSGYLRVDFKTEEGGYDMTNENIGNKIVGTVMSIMKEVLQNLPPVERIHFDASIREERAKVYIYAIKDLIPGTKIDNYVNDTYDPNIEVHMNTPKRYKEKL